MLPTPTGPGRMNRRDFIAGVSAIGVAAAAAAPAMLAPRAAQAQTTAGAANRPQKLIGIQAGAVSFVDEGVDQVLDVFQQNHIDTIFLATFTYGRGIAGRQVPGQPLPDHGKQAYDERQFHGGNYATPHPRFYEHTSLKQTRAPEHGDVDVLELVLPKTK